MLSMIRLQNEGKFSVFSLYAYIQSNPWEITSLLISYELMWLRSFDKNEVRIDSSMNHERESNRIIIVRLHKIPAWERYGLSNIFIFLTLNF